MSRQSQERRLEEVAAQTSRNRPVVAAVVLAEVTGVAGERLVGALAGEHHLDVLVRHFAHLVEGERGRRGDGLLQVPDGAGQEVCEVIRGKHHLVMVRAQALG